MAPENRSTTGSPWLLLWQEIGEGYLGGVQHALNNRVAALSAVAQVLGDGVADAQPLVGSLAREVERLQETVGMLSLLRRARSRAAEPVMLPELVGSLLPLLPMYGELRDVEFAVGEDPGVLPLWAERDQLTRVLLVLLTTAGLRAQSIGSGEVLVRFGGDEQGVVLTAECREPEEEPDDEEARVPDARGVEEAVRELGGAVALAEEDAERPRYELRLPTLLEVRRRERAAAS